MPFNTELRAKNMETRSARDRKIASYLFKNIDKFESNDLRDKEGIIKVLNELLREIYGMDDADFDKVFNEEFAHDFTKPRLVVLLESILKDFQKEEQEDVKKYHLIREIEKRSGFRKHWWKFHRRTYKTWDPRSGGSY
jgi:uncharacterized membrane protein required for colicin V production